MPAVVAVRPRICTLADMPAGPVLTGPPGQAEIGISDGVRRNVVLIATGSREAALILSAGRNGHLPLYQVREAARGKGWSITAEYEASEGLVELIYRCAQTQSDRTREGSDTRPEALFDQILLDAARLAASDIHIVRERGAARVSMRIHGELSPYDALSVEMADALCACVYNTQGEDRATNWNPREGQDANVRRVIDGAEYRIRYAHYPAYPDGYHTVMRVLVAGRAFKFARHLTDLGYSEAQAHAIHDMVESPSGVLFLSGETGSGKSTTIANLLHIVQTQSAGAMAILTIENPPEYEIPGVTQSPVLHVRDERGSQQAFLEAMKSAMRRDPDLLMVGEVRDAPTALLVFQAAQSGHPVVTTIHAGGVFGVIQRLEGLGAGSLGANPIHRGMLAGRGVIAGIIHQTLLPVLCPHCAVPFDAAAAARERRHVARIHAAFLDREKLRTRGPGCGECRGGVRGRTACAEILVPDDTIRSAWRAGDDEAARRHWIEVGRRRDDGVTGWTIQRVAADRVSRGLVDPLDAEHHVGHFEVVE